MPDKVRVQGLGEGVFELQMRDAAGANGLSDDFCRELSGAFAALAAEPAARVVLLSGLPEVFCSGATLEMLERYAAGERTVRDMPLRPEEVLGFPLPLVAAVEGHAVGGGLVLAACCDVVVAAEGSRYGLNFTGLGFTPGMGSTALFPSLVGHQLACEMMFSGKLYKGRELRGRGLFSHVVPGPEVRDVALELARRFAEKPRHVLTLLKEALALPRRQAAGAAISREHLMHSLCFSRPEVAAGLRERY